MIGGNATADTVVFFQLDVDGLHEDVHPRFGEKPAFVCGAGVLRRVQQMMERFSRWNLSFKRRSIRIHSQKEREKNTHINPSLPLPAHRTRLIHIPRCKIRLRIPPMPTQPHPPPHRIPPPTLLIPKRNRRPRRVLALLRRLIPIIRGIDNPRTAVRPVPARAAWERGGFALVELVVVGLGRADGVWAGYGGQVGWDGDFADFAAGDVEQFRGDGGEGWA